MGNYIVVNLDDIEDAEITEVVLAVELRPAGVMGPLGPVASVWYEHHNGEHGYWVTFTNGAGERRRFNNGDHMHDHMMACAAACDHARLNLTRHLLDAAAMLEVKAQLRTQGNFTP